MTMTRYFGKIGFSLTEETSPGIWTEKIVTRNYRGEVLKNYIRRETQEKINDNINISNNISIVADSFAYGNMGMIRFVEWMGTLWNVESIEVQSPRLILSIGGVYNGPEPEETGATEEV